MAAMAAAKWLGATRGVVVSYANSGDSSVMPDRSRVVGYGAVVLTRGEDEIKDGQPKVDYPRLRQQAGCDRPIRRPCFTWPGKPYPDSF